jgi:hypothetical protein
MKVIAIVGSPRKNGNTQLLASHTLKFNLPDWTFDLVQLVWGVKRKKSVQLKMIFNQYMKK